MVVSSSLVTFTETSDVAPVSGKKLPWLQGNYRVWIYSETQSDMIGYTGNLVPSWILITHLLYKGFAPIEVLHVTP